MEPCFFLLEVIIFGSVWFGFYQKNNQTDFFLKKNRNRFKSTGFGSVWFFEQKPVLLGFFRFGSI
jgi:hypothetical protein